MNPVLLDPLDIGIAVALVLISGVLSMVLSLGIHRDLFVAAARMIIQLVLVGFLLRWVFGVQIAWITALIVTGMILAGSYEATARQSRRLSGVWHLLVGLASVAGSTLPIAAVGLLILSQDPQWGGARHIIPLLGIVLGTAMNAASIALDRFYSTVWQQRDAVEARLALGQGRWTALDRIVPQVVRAGTIPIVNQMAGAGVITMPGIMSGQILAGMDPLEAGKYQIFLMMLLAGAGFAGVLLATFLSVWRIMDERDRLRLDRLAPAKR